MILFQDRIEKRKLVREQQIAERAIREKKRQEEEKAERIRKEEEEERKKKEEEEKKKNALAAMSMNFGGAAQRQNNRKGKVKLNSYYSKTSGFFIEFFSKPMNMKSLSKVSLEREDSALSYSSASK